MDELEDEVKDAIERLWNEADGCSTSELRAALERRKEQLEEYLEDLDR